MKKITYHKGWLTAILSIIPFYIFAILFQVIGLGFTSALGEYGIIEFDIDTYLEVEDVMRDYLAADTIIQYFDLIGIFVLLWILMKFVDKEPFINLGFNIKGKMNDIILGMALGLLLMAVGYSTLIFLGEIKFVSFNYDLKSIILLFLLFIGVSVVEETYVRGYVLKNLLKSFNPVVSLIISSAIFSLLHFFNPNVNYIALTELFIAGILLGVSYVYTKNLWFPIALHLSWNFFQVMFGFNVSGMDTYSLIEFEILENNNINGGDFGFEGSYLSILFSLIMIYFLWRHYKKFAE
jgi:membrane protease YdiL (CAAX protease family)